MASNSETWHVPEGGLYPIVCTLDGKMIATLADTGDEMEAHARLIAAAPKLRATLRLAQRWMQQAGAHAPDLIAEIDAALELTEARS